MKLFLLFLLAPIVEIALFIQLGGLIGLFPTLGVIIITAIVGAYLARTQFPLVIDQFRDAASHLKYPMNPILQAIAIFAGGLLLLTPGFFTDMIGFLLLIPYTREFLVNFFMVNFAGIILARSKFTSSPARGDGIIDGNAIEIDPENK